MTTREKALEAEGWSKERDGFWRHEHISRKHNLRSAEKATLRWIANNWIAN